MGGGKKGGNEAAQARADEQQRQDRIRQGTARVNSIFDGATTGSGILDASAAYDPNATYYLADGSSWSPQASNPVSDPAQMFGMGRSGDEATRQAYVNSGKTAQQQFAEAVQGGKLFSGTTKSSGFDDAYFDGRRQAYIDYANPQLEEQYGNAQKELAFALSRGGLLNSSVRAEKTGELQKLYDVNKQKIADEALSHATQARNSVEDARANLISTLNATGDAEGAASSAITRASALSQPAAYSPLSQLFADFTSGLGTQAALERANYYSGGQTGARYSTGLFTPSNSSVKVT
ncbi:hypothetical protein [Agrobacterium tumefaciens]|uniref:hypothetical protein n=1 Tax=Agrobacterium tumefaciens TaxID=358 RepID=UPI0021D2A2CB|nr:hypothetical protein [Agrobacterium tumefaciens]UXS23079.1 hypothetical protein FY153_00925 [Agrobacterium tumefaciens]